MNMSISMPWYIVHCAVAVTGDGTDPGNVQNCILRFCHSHYQ